MRTGVEAAEYLGDLCLAWPWARRVDDNQWRINRDKAGAVDVGPDESFYLLVCPGSGDENQIAVGVCDGNTSLFV
jgi:hypothetical protein